MYSHRNKQNCQRYPRQQQKGKEDPLSHNKRTETDIRTLEDHVDKLLTKVKILQDQIKDLKEQEFNWKCKVKCLQALKKGSTMETVENLQKQNTKLQETTDLAKTLQK